MKDLLEFMESKPEVQKIRKSRKWLTRIAYEIHDYSAWSKIPIETVLDYLMIRLNVKEVK